MARRALLMVIVHLGGTFKIDAESNVLESSDAVFAIPSISCHLPISFRVGVFRLANAPVFKEHSCVA